MNLFGLVVDNFPSVAAAIVLAALGGHIAWRTKQRERTLAAAASLRHSVLSELVGLYPQPLDWPRDIHARLARSLPALSAAIEQFRPFVPWYKRSHFTSVWNTFRCHCETDIPAQCDTAKILYGGAKVATAQALLIHDVQALLSFASE